MSKQSRVEKLKELEQEQEVEKTKELPVVKPAVVTTVGRKTNRGRKGFNKKPKSVPPAKNKSKDDSKDDSAALLKELVDAQARSEKSIEKLAESQIQLIGQFSQDHRVLTDHEWRIHDVETFLGIIPKSERPAAEGQPPAVREQSVAEEQPSVEEQSSVKEQPLAEEAEEASAQEQPSPSASQLDALAPDGAVPREMYEAKVFENDNWVWYGPYPKISRAEQAVNGDLSKIRIVQVWYDNDRDIVIRQLTAEELDRYCK